MSLAQYGFIINTIASDGALENQSANKKVAILTANDGLVNHPVKKRCINKIGLPNEYESCLSSSITIKRWCYYFH